MQLMQMMQMMSPVRLESNLARQTPSAPPACGGGVGRGWHARSVFVRAPSLALQPKSDLSDFGRLRERPNSGVPEFGCKRGRGHTERAALMSHKNKTGDV
jgi:hypothetical protein